MAVLTEIVEDGESDGGKRDVATWEEEEEEEEEKEEEEKEKEREHLIPRKYQLEVVQRAKERNTIIYLETGCGKTLIAVLLIMDFLNSPERSNRRFSIFLVPTANLVQQQSGAIERHTGLNVGQYFGRKGSHYQQFDEFQVLVMTPQVLLNNLHHSFIKMEDIGLLIFDECHHCQKDHPYALIMQEFYHPNVFSRRPRIFGMTASPIIGKGQSDGLGYLENIGNLEKILDSKIYMVQDEEDLSSFVPSPNLEVIEYLGSYLDSGICNLLEALKNVKMKWFKSLDGQDQEARTSGNGKDLNFYTERKKVIAKAHRDMEYCLFDLGLWCTKHVAELWHETYLNVASKASIFDAQLDYNEETNYFIEIFSVLNTFVTTGGISESLFMSNKVAALVKHLLIYRESDVKCIVFVERVMAARVLARFLSGNPDMSFLRCKFIAGRSKGCSSSETKQTLDEFRTNKVNCLVATSVAEEGLDIQSCSLVIRFDLPKTPRSFIQSRGRARMPGSFYIIFLERGNLEQYNLLKCLINSDEKMQGCVKEGVDAELNPSVDHSDIERFEVKSTGASVSLNNSIQLLNCYCSTLRKDEFHTSSLTYSYARLPEGFECTVFLPINAPFQDITSRPCISPRMAKQMASLKACVRLHELGVLTDHLLPLKQTEDSLHSRKHDIAGSKADTELQNLIIPSTLVQKNADYSDCIHLHAYGVNFLQAEGISCIDFALLVEVPLPDDAANLTVQLYVSNGRTVTAQLVQSAGMLFSAEQVQEAKEFQKKIFSFILSSKEKDAIPLPMLRGEGEENTKRFYLLPQTLNHPDSSEEIQIDWTLIKKVLHPVDGSTKVDAFASSGTKCYHVAERLISEEDLIGSLVKTTHLDNFYCITGVLNGTNIDSKFSESSFRTYRDYYKKRYNIDFLYPEQPLLQAKRPRHVKNLLQNRSAGQEYTERKAESFVELPPELCSIQILGLSDILLNTAALLPSFMHRLECFLGAVQLRDIFGASFTGGDQLSANLVLEALTTESCQETFSLERLELLGDSVLKYAVSCNLFLVYDKHDEGFLTLKRKFRISNHTLYKLGVEHNIHTYIRDERFCPYQWIGPFWEGIGRTSSDSGSEKTEHQLIECSSTSGFLTRRLHPLQRKTVADAVEALIGAYLVHRGLPSALAFMEWIGIKVGCTPDHIASICNASLDNPPLFHEHNLTRVEEILGYKFKHHGLLLEAFSHASFDNFSSRCYQRLEFLGDSVLDYLITKFLYSSYRGLNPGQLTDLRAATVGNETFARVAVKYSLHNHVLEKNPRLHENIRCFVSFIEQNLANGNGIGAEWPKGRCPKVLGDIVESLAGALLVDTLFDVDEVWNVFEKILQPIVTPEKLQLHPVRELQELCQQMQKRKKVNVKLKYSYESSRKQWSAKATILVEDNEIVGSTNSSDKKSSKRLASRDALQKLKDEGYEHSYHSLIKELNFEDEIDSNAVQEIPQNHASTKEKKSETNLWNICKVDNCSDIVAEDDNDMHIDRLFGDQDDKFWQQGQNGFSNINEYQQAGLLTTDKSVSKGEHFNFNELTMRDVSANQNASTIVQKSRPRSSLSNSRTEDRSRFSKDSDLYFDKFRTEMQSSGNHSRAKKEVAEEEYLQQGKNPSMMNEYHQFTRSQTGELFTTREWNFLKDFATQLSINDQYSNMNLREEFSFPSFSTESKSRTGLPEVLGSPPVPSSQSTQPMKDIHVERTESTLGQARANLYELCAKKKWKEPKFYPIKKDAASSDGLFTYEVQIQVPNLGYVECEGEPRKSTKLARDSAASRLLDWLKEENLS